MIAQGFIKDVNLTRIILKYSKLLIVKIKT